MACVCTRILFLSFAALRFCMLAVSVPVFELFGPRIDWLEVRIWCVWLLTFFEGTYIFLQQWNETDAAAQWNIWHCPLIQRKSLLFKMFLLHTSVCLLLTKWMVYIYVHVMACDVLISVANVTAFLYLLAQPSVLSSWLFIRRMCCLRRIQHSHLDFTVISCHGKPFTNWLTACFGLALSCVMLCLYMWCGLGD